MTHETLQSFLKGLRMLNLKLSSWQLEQFSIYLEEIKKWNSKFNLIGPATDEEIITRHFLDSLSAVSALHNNCTALPAGRVLDIGTGAGFPGIPIKIAKPEISLTLLDSSHKKTEFLRHLIKKLNIDAGIFCGRAEDVVKLSTHSKKYDIVVARAVAKLSTLEKICFPFLNRSGILILQLSKKTDIILRNGKIMKKFNPPSKILPGRTILTIRKKQDGFTLIELMVVVTIIGILAAISIPKFADLIKRTKQGKTKGELGRLRSALTLYYGTMEGVMYPQNAAAVLCETGPMQDKYLSKMPTVKLGPGSHDETTDMDDFAIGEALTDIGNWGYISSRGSVFVNCTHLDAGGEYISSW